MFANSWVLKSGLASAIWWLLLDVKNNPIHAQARDQIEHNKRNLKERVRKKQIGGHNYPVQCQMIKDIVSAHSFEDLGLE